MAKQHKEKAVEPVESVETVAVLEESPQGVQLPRWRLRPIGTQEWRTVEAENVEDAIRAFNGSGNGGTVFTRKKLEIEAA